MQVLFNDTIRYNIKYAKPHATDEEVSRWDASLSAALPACLPACLPVAAPCSTPAPSLSPP